METSRTFRLTDQLDGSGIVDALSRRFRVADRDDRSTRSYLDSFDGRLHACRRGLAVESAGGDRCLRWVDLEGQALDRTAEIEVAPRFADEVGSASLRRELAGALGNRALLPLVEVSHRRREIRVLDEADKTVARLVVLEEGEAVDPGSDVRAAVEATVRALPMRGYEEHHRRVVEFLSRDLGLESIGASHLEQALDAVGRQPGHGRPFEVDLTADLPTGVAFGRLFEHLLETMLAQEEGLVADIDTEFLHDFRVALRRTRALLGHVDGVLDPAVLADFRARLRWLGQATGPVRELDVFSAWLDDHRATLAGVRAAALEPLVAAVARRRASERRTLVRVLSGRRYRKTLADWRRVLDAGRTGPRADRPIGPHADRRISKLERRVLERGRAIDAASPAVAYHDLRLAGKKLRYLIEAFGRLYRPKRVRRAVRTVKYLQDCLGIVQDSDDQTAMLESFAADLLAGGEAAGAILAIGRVEASVEAHRQGAIAEFAERFERFQSEGIAERLGPAR